MSFQRKFLRLTWYSLIYLFVTIAVFAAVALTLARMWLPSATQYKSDVEQWVGEVLEQKVIIESMNADWYGLEPQLVLEGVQFLSKDGKTIISDFARVKVGVDIVASILRQAPVPGALVIEGARIVLVRNEDGSFTVSGFGSTEPDEKTDAETSQILERWILEQRLLKIENSSLVWRDKQSEDEARLFSDVNLAIRNDGSRHQIEGSVFLPQDLGSHILFFLDLRGNVFSSNDWSGNAQVTGVGLELTNWMKETRFRNLELSKSVVSFSSWARLQGAKISEIRGELLASDIQLRSLTDRKLNKIDSVSTDFSVQRQDGSWNFTADGLSLVHNGEVWEKMRIDARAKEKTKVLELELSQLSIEHAFQLLAISDVLKNRLGAYSRQAKPRGDLESFTLFFNIENPDAPQFAAGGRFRDFRIQAWEKIPGIGPLSGEFELSNADGYVWLDSEEWSLDLPKMFKSERDFDKLSGSVSWTRSDDGAWEVIGRNMNVSDDKVSAKGSMTLLLEPDKKPFLDLAVSLKAKGITTTRKYLPDAMMKDTLVKWIDDSVKLATVTAGGLIYYGRLGEYPFVNNEGRFSLNLSLDKTRLKYLKDWPAIDSIDGEFELTSKGLKFYSQSAEVYSNKITNVSVVIPRFKSDDPLVAIAGTVVGPTADKFQYMYDSPLNAIFAKNLKIFEVTGESSLDIGLDIPLKPGRPLSVSGKLHATENRLNAESINLDLQNINGDLLFDTKGIYGEGLKVSLGEINLDAGIDTVDSKDGREIVFRHEGEMREAQLGFVFDRYVKQPQWSNYFAGDVDASARLYIPIREGGERSKITLTAKSDLKGLDIRLPEPLGKKSSDIYPFEMSMELSGEDRDLSLMLGKSKAKMQFAVTGGTTKLERGAIGLGVDPILPTENSFHFLGEIDRFFWSEWAPLLIPPEGQSGLFKGGGGAGSVHFDVAVKHVEVMGAEFETVKLQASNTAQGWTIHAQGPKVQGSVYMPSVWKTAPLVLDMQKLHILRPKDKNDGKQLDPNSLPQIRFSSEDFRFDNMIFGKTSFSSEKIPGGIKLNRFVSQSKLSDFDVKGTWTYQEEVHHSNFNIGLATRDFGENMHSWGYDDIVEKGDGSLNISAAWDGSPVDFTLSSLKGKVEVSMNNVRLLDLNVGAAKMLGLLSLEAIPRRLFFDFRDVVKKGMVFDSVLGQFDVQAGDMFTSGLIMTGPSGRMGLAGRIGLEDRDYDLVVTFIPKAFDSLPVIGGLASTAGVVAAGVAAPALGATIYVMQKLFQSQMDELSAVQYTIGGTWQEPQMTQVKAQSAVPEETEFVDEQ